MTHGGGRGETQKRLWENGRKSKGTSSELAGTIVALVQPSRAPGGETKPRGARAEKCEGSVKGKAEKGRRWT